MELSTAGVSVVVPVYQSEETIEALHRELKEVFRSLSLNFELIYVNDASPDDSAARLQQLQQQYPEEVRYLTNPQNMGQHQSVLRGLEQANMPLSVVMDADLQDQPGFIPMLLTALKSPHEAVFLKRDDVYQGLGRMFTSRVIKLIVYALTGLHFKAGMYFVMSERAKRRVLRMPREHAYVSIMLAGAGLPFTYVQGKRVRRVAGKSAYTFKKRVKAAMRALRCWWSCRNFKSAPD